MSVGGSGIPRLQDLSYVEVAIANLAKGATFEQVRRSIVDRAAELADDADTDGTFNERKWEAARLDGTKYVHPTVDVLKELMRLGWLERHILPSGPSSAYLHTDTTFQLTDGGRAWAQRFVDDRREAYNSLLGSLVQAHPHLEGFLLAVGARPESKGTHMTIPLLRWDGAVHDSEAAYLAALIDHVAGAVAGGTLLWTADRETIDTEVRGYVGRVSARLEARKKPHSRREFVNWCDEAVTKVAFASAGCPLDYTSQELLRRWTRFLGVANFSYYAPGPYALRLWATGVVSGSGPDVQIERRVGRNVRRRALEALLRIWLEQPVAATAGMYLPIWELRAAVCWQERISDEEFDKAVSEALAGEQRSLGFKIHLDQASVRARPSSTRPLVLTPPGGPRRVFNLMTIIPMTRKEQP